MKGLFFAEIEGTQMLKNKEMAFWQACLYLEKGYQQSTAQNKTFCAIKR